MSEEGEEEGGILDIVLLFTFLLWLTLNAIILFGLLPIEHLRLASILNFSLLAAVLGELVLYVYLLGNPIVEAD